MKLKHLFAGMLAFAALACKPENVEPEIIPSLDVPTKAFTVEAAGATATLTFTTNQDWTLTPSEEWVSVDPAAGAASTEAVTVTITAEDNTVEAERTATILVKAGELEETVTLTQVAYVIPEDGTEAYPYLVKTVEDVVAIREKASLETPTYFRLENDIDMTSVENWIPINWDAEFARQIHFDGNGKTIANFAPKTWNDVNIDGEPVVASYPSFFGVLWGSCKDLTFTNAVIADAASSAGILAGYAGTTDKPAVVTNVSVQGTVTAAINRVGGLAGVAVSSTFPNCSADVAVTTTSTDAGGFVGYVQGTSTFTNCNVKVALVSKAVEKCRCGGFIGWNRATETTIENCNVLEGSTITDESGRTETKISSFGGFIGFGDSDAEATKLTVKNCTAKVTVNSGDWAQVNSTFIGSIGYNPEVLIENCSVEGDVIAGPNPQNYAGGLIARAQMAGIEGTIAGKVTINNCSFKGNVAGRAGVGGLVGAVDNGELEISGSSVEGTVKNFQNNIGGILGLSTATSVKIDGCSFDGKVDGVSYVGGVLGGTGKTDYYEITRTSVKGEIIASNSYSGGFVGAAQADVEQVLSNCISSASVTLTGTGKQIGGIVGTATSKITITNCIATGNLKTNTVAGGIIGRVGFADSKVSNCIAWNADLTANTASLVGAVIGSLEKNGEYASCVRRADMVVNGTSVAVADQDDITTVAATTAYHGKAAAADATASSVAKTLGWDEAIWDLSGAVPALK
jgi:hypothetical protein